MQQALKLYHYWRSSCSWRVRWAIALKKLHVEFVAVDLLTDESESGLHLQRNPMGFVPVLEFLNPNAPYRYLSESMAIIEWLEETYPTPSLLPGDAFHKAKIRQLAEIINSGTQPLQNISVGAFLSEDPAEKKRWNAHWIHKGLEAYEDLVSKTAGKFSVGNSITLPDLFLIPQVYNARRQDVNLDPFPTVVRIYEAASETEGFRMSAPDQFKPI